MTWGIAMAKFVVVGAGLGGMSAAYELRETLGKGHDIVLVGVGESFGFTPSNPWLAVGWRKQDDITLPVGEHVGKHGIRYDSSGVAQIDAAGNAVSINSKSASGVWLTVPTVASRRRKAG